MEMTYEQYTSPGYLNGFRLPLRQIIGVVTGHLEAGEHREMAASAKAVRNMANIAMGIIAEIEAARDDADQLDAVAADAFALAQAGSEGPPASLDQEASPAGAGDSATAQAIPASGEPVPAPVAEVSTLAGEAAAAAGESDSANTSEPDGPQATDQPTLAESRRNDATAGMLQLMPICQLIQELYMGYQYQTRPRQAQPEFSPEDLSPDRVLN